MTSHATALEMRGVTKSFAGNTVLADVSLSAEAGEVHALVGENGAGKSTLMKILAGVYQPDTGEIFIEDELVALLVPRCAGPRNRDDLSGAVAGPSPAVAENPFLGASRQINASQIINRREMNGRAASSCRQWIQSRPAQTRESIERRGSSTVEIICNCRSPSRNCDGRANIIADDS